MKPSRMLIATFAIFATTPALAQPSATPPVAVPAPVALPAPQTSWSDISNINGQLVPVGKHNDYHYTFRRTNISVNPIGWLAGFYGISASYAFTDHIALRADANVFNNVLGTSFGGSEFGISAPIYLRRTYQGPFIEPGLIARSWGDGGGSCGDGCSSQTSAFGPEMLIGYHVTFDSGFNMAAAIGLAKMVTSNNDDSGSQLQPAGYFRVGYAF